MSSFSQTRSPATRATLAAVVASVGLAGCRSGPGMPDIEFGPPPQESTSAVAPSVELAIRELTAKVRSGSPLDMSDGVSFNEAQRMMYAYLARRAELSDTSLKRSMATDNPDYIVLRDAQHIGRLGGLLRKVTGEESPFQAIDTAALPLQYGESPSDDLALQARIVEGIYTLQALRALQASSSPSLTTRNQDLEITDWVKELLELDLRGATNRGALTATEVRARLAVDAEALEWIGTCTAQQFVDAYPWVSRALTELSPEGFAALRGDSDTARGFATFSKWWGEQLNDTDRNAWSTAPALARRNLWLLLRTIPAHAATGSATVAIQEPTDEERVAVYQALLPISQIKDNKVESPPQAPPGGATSDSSLTYVVDPSQWIIASVPKLDHWS